MPEINTSADVTTSEVVKAASPKSAAKKSVKKVTPKKEEKKATPKKSPKKETKKETKKEEKKDRKPREKKEGLRTPQIRILKAMTKVSKPLTRKQISEKASVDAAMLNSYIGAHDLAVRQKNDKNYPSLLTLGYVKGEVMDVDGRDTHVYTITANGKKQVAK